MASLRVNLFGGIIPRLADRGLPDNAAQFAMNAKLYSGELRSWNRLRALATLPISGAKTVYHYRDSGLDKYAAFDKYTNITKSALLNDAYGRVYYSNADGAFVTTTARLAAGSAPFKLGVPAPGGTFTVVPAGGTSQQATTRVYVAICVSAYGEESETGTPVSVNGNTDGTWTVNGLNALTIDTVNYPNITKLRLYRTITSATGVDFRQVNEWAIGARPASYVDNITDTDLSDNTVLQSLSWDLPPAGLSGLIAVAGGFLAGFVGKTVYLSVPWFPHAWPADYQWGVEDDIVGLGTFGNTIVICTKGRPQILMGNSPDAMSLAKLELVQPCLSARSIVSSSAGVMYASTDGLVLVDGGSSRGLIASRNWVTKDEWMGQFDPANQMAAIYQDRYFSFYSSQLGLTVGFDDAISGCTELQQEGISSVDVDIYTGQALVTIGNTVYEWDGDNTGALQYQWRSKIFQLPRPENMGVIQIRGTFNGTIPITVMPAVSPSGWALNDVEINAGNAAKNHGGEINGPATWAILGIDPSAGAVVDGVATKVYADGALVWFGSISSENPVRLPSGYKAHTYEVEVQGVSPLFSVTLASTGKELAQLP